jgi:hypothetical protein
MPFLCKYAMLVAIWEMMSIATCCGNGGLMVIILMAIGGFLLVDIGDY